MRSGWSRALASLGQLWKLCFWGQKEWPESIKHRRGAWPPLCAGWACVDLGPLPGGSAVFEEWQAAGSGDGATRTLTQRPAGPYQTLHHGSSVSADCHLFLAWS